MEATDLLLQEFRAFRDNEFRAFRDEVTGWETQTGERVAKLEDQAHNLCGNGQPGRMALAENRITNLEHLHWKLVGVAATVSTLLTLAYHWLPWFRH